MKPGFSIISLKSLVPLAALLIPVSAEAFSFEKICSGVGIFLPETVSTTVTTVNGRYTATVSDCCCVEAVECNPDPTNPSPNCQLGAQVTLSKTSILEEPGCLIFKCNLEDSTAEIQEQWDGTCHPEVGVFFDRPTEIANGLDDDCDGFVDDEQCDDVDNDGDGLLNEDPGSCLLQVLAVPIAWQRSLEDFRSFAQDVFDNFLAQVRVTSCSDNFRLEILDENILDAPPCATGCGAREFKLAFRNTYGEKKERDYDVVVGLVDHDICGATAGCSDNTKFIWIEGKNSDLREDEKDEVFSHEVGHLLGLGDEYCSRPAGSTDDNCSPKTATPDFPNPLSADLGCDPNPGGGCCNIILLGNCADVDYGVCCKGNLALDHESMGGRAIMSYQNADRPRGYDKTSLAHIMAPPNPRSATNPYGQTPLTCSFAYTGAKPVVYADVDVTPSGNMSLNSAVMTVGRLALGSPGQSGNMSIRVSTREGTLFEDFFDADDKYDGPTRSDVDYSNIHFETVNREVIVAMPAGMDQEEPLKLTLAVEGTVTSQICLTHATDGTLTEDTEDPTVAGCGAGSTTIAECSTSGGVPRFDPQLSSFFSNVAAADNCDPDVSLSNDAPALFSLGDTKVTFTAKDSNQNVGTCAMDVRVRDTVAPSITAPTALVGVECTQGMPQGATPPLGTPAVTDLCDIAPTVTNDAPQPLPLGTTRVAWTATDSSGNSASAMQAVSVVDTTPPTIACPGTVTAQCTGPGIASGVDVGRAAGSDVCGTVALTNDSPGTFPLGTSLVTHAATDQQGLMATCVQRVEVEDTTPPVIRAVSASPHSLWPPNHEMQAVHVAVEAADLCDTSAPRCSITAIQSNEAGDARGDGNTDTDWRITGPLEAELRAERSGQGSGRVYTIEVACLDAAGNPASSTTTVSVPHS